MIETWRWYGGLDRLSLAQIAQTGATGIVTALHEIPYGEIWPRETIARRKAEIEAAGFHWEVVESLPIHERIKRCEGDLSALFANYRQSMANLASEGLRVICYNFMPLIDWTRTDLRASLPRGGTCLRFDAVHMAAFDVYMLARPDAEEDWPAHLLPKAKAWADTASDAQKDELLNAIMAGLPGAYDRYDMDGLREALALYDGMDHESLRANYARFLAEVIPTAEELGLRFCVHPDDPPRDLLGLPRIVSNAEDIAWILNTQDSPANGLTLCSGSLGANPDNDVPAIARR
ncbi:MAG: mannonate dehydratase, partial [Mangrovicoccus sp.]